MPIFCERFLQISNILSRGGSRGGRLGRSSPLKLTKVNLFTIILYNSENNICD